MKRYIKSDTSVKTVKTPKDFKSEYERRLDNVIRPDEETLFDDMGEVLKWLKEVDNIEDTSDSSI